MSDRAAIEAVLRLAHGLLKAGKYGDAIPHLVRAGQMLPDNPVVFDDLGRAYLLTRHLPQAIAALQRSIGLRPGFARTHATLGLALAQSGEYEAALAAHRRAIALDPQLAEAHGRAADILLRKGRREEAIAEYERAHEAAPETSFGLLCAAKALVARDRPTDAEKRLRELLARDPRNGEAHLVLAHILTESGRFDEAAASFEQSIALAPWQATAYHGLVSSRKLTEADRPLLARIEARLAASDVAERQRMTLHFAAGKGLDDLRDYAGAIAHFDAANTIRKRLSPPFDRRYLEQRVDRLVAHFTRERFAGNPASGGAGEETPLLVLGMPRSGTTLLERVVSSHPDVAGGGELPFWNEAGSAWADAEVKELAEGAEGVRAGYLRVLRGIGPRAARVTDKMPFNFLWIGLVHLLFPRARFVHCRRNPIDTCLSIYGTQFTQNWGYASDRADLAFYYRQYLRLMEHWRAVLPPDRLLEVDYEAATASPEATARRLVAFTGLRWDDACLRPEQNPDAVKTASTWQARQPIYRTSVERWRHYEPWLGELRALLP